MSITLIAIDPGASGGIAVRMANGMITIHNMPDTPMDLSSLITDCVHSAVYPIKAYVEQVSGYVGGAGQPGSRAFNFGQGYGEIIGILTHAKIPFELVRPQKWQRALGIPPAEKIRVTADMNKEQRDLVRIRNEKFKREHKNRLKETAQRLFPSVPNITLKTCDALLILEYAIRDTTLSF